MLHDFQDLARRLMGTCFSKEHLIIARDMKMSCQLFVVWFSIFFVFLFPSILYSQTDQSSLFSVAPRGSSTNFHFAEPNELTIVVNLLGAVQRPGRYEISRSIDLVNLLSLAGGTSENADLGDIRITRMIKTGTATERREIIVNIEKLTKINDADLLLSQGDYIFVDRSSSITLSEVLSGITTVAVVTTAVISVINQTRK